MASTPPEPVTTPPDIPEDESGNNGPRPPKPPSGA